MTGDNIDPGGLRITTDDGVPAVEFPSGQLLRLRPHVTVEDRIDHPFSGKIVNMAAEADYDDFAWWMLYPEDDSDFPEISIEPEFIDPDEGGDPE